MYMSQRSFYLKCSSLTLRLTDTFPGKSVVSTRTTMLPMLKILIQRRTLVFILLVVGLAMGASAAPVSHRKAVREIEARGCEYPAHAHHIDNFVDSTDDSGSASHP